MATFFCGPSCTKRSILRSEPGATLPAIAISGTGITREGQMPLGLLFFTNFFRSFSKAGAATADSEVLVSDRPGPVLPLKQVQTI